MNEPRLSIVLTGTPGQLEGIIPSAENGLFSRFCFYSFNEMATWQDVSPAGQPLNRTELFAEVGAWFSDQVVEFGKNQVIFTLADEQWTELNETYSELLKKTQVELGAESQGMVKRSGLILYRIAMVLSAVRRLMHPHRWNEDIVCTEADFRSALELAEVYTKHAANTFKSLPKKERTGLNESQRKFLHALPEKDLFTRAEAVQVGEGLAFSASSVDKFLAALYHSNYLVREKTKGESQKYRKVKF